MFDSCYFHLYGTTVAHDADYNGAAYSEPWVALTEQTGKVTFNKKPRVIIMTSASDTKVYDGVSLTNDTVTVTGEGFKDGDGATYRVDGNQTLVGSSANTFTYILNEETSADDYEITPVYGRLTVTDGTGEDEEPVDPYLITTITAVPKPGRDYYLLGETVTFNVTVTNIYVNQRTLYASALEGDTLAQSDFTDIAGGETVQTTMTHTVTENDIWSGSYTAFVTGGIYNGVSATVDCEIEMDEVSPALTIGLVCTSTPVNEEYYQEGEDITYEITVTNIGNVTLTEIEITAELFAYEPFPISSLAPGEDETLTGFYYTVTAEDVNEGSVTATASASCFANDEEVFDEADDEEPTAGVL